uniref:Di19 C-terminal domain-containing protein n=1 Tax=Manihot esculenta TaxID=3983 RepID=A0A2C9VGN1_MANES
MQQTKRSQKGGHYSTLALLRKELREGNLQSLFERSSCIFSSFNTAPDPLLSSFILPMADDFASLFSELFGNMMSPLSIKDQEDKAKGLNLFKGWLLSAILDDIL